MKIKHPLRSFLALAGSSLLAISSAHAVDGDWISVNTGNWSDAANWSSNPDVPGGAGSIISIASDITGARTVTIDGTSRTVGALTIGDANNSHAFNLNASGGASLIFDNNGNEATLTNTGSQIDTISANITLADNLAVNGSGRVNITGNISETGSARTLTVDSTGTLLLSGDNSFSGGVTLNAGQLNINSNTALGTGTFTINGGRLDIAGTGAGTTVTTTNANIWNASWVIGRGTTGTATWNNNGTIELGGDVTITAPNNFAVLNLGGDISGGHNLNISSGSITATLSGNNTHTGTTLSNGRLNINSSTAVGGVLNVNGGTIDNTSGSAVTVANYTIGANVTFGGTNDLTLTGDWSNSTNNRSVTLNGDATLTIDGTYINAQNNNQTFNVNGPGNTLVLGGIALSHNSSTRTLTLGGTGDILVTGAVVNGGTATGGNLTINRSGTVTLEGASTYVGTTTVTAGTLLINNATGSGTGAAAVTVGINGTLGGSGTIGGATTVNGNLRPGNSPGILTFSNSLALTASSVTTFEIDGLTRGIDYDGVNVGTTLGLGGNLVFDIGTILGSDATFNLFNVIGSTSGNFATVSLAGAMGTGSFTFDNSDAWTFVDAGDNIWSFSQSTGDLSFIVIPEPTTALLGGLGMLLLLRRRR